MTLVSLADYTPAPRFDGVPWAQARLEESVAKDGPWTPRQTFALSPIDADPANPETRQFTTVNATLIDGWYRIVWIDGSFAESATEPVQNILPVEAEYYPTLAQVARHLASRTRDQYGAIRGTFDDKTSPKGGLVSSLIPEAAEKVADVVGDVVPDEFLDDARNLVALRTAMQVELDFFPDQINTNRSPYQQLSDLFDKESALLAQAIERYTLDGRQPTGPGKLSSSSFPPAIPWLTKKM